MFSMISVRFLCPAFAAGAAFTLFSGFVSAAGPGLPYTSAADVEMSQDRLELATSLVEHAIQDDELRGAVVLVARRGSIVLHRAYGWRDLESKIPMQKDSLFRMASNTKAVTAAGILLLAQDGRLRLDDPVGTYFSEFQSEKSNQMTIRHLLTHTSGLRIKSLFLDPLMKPSEQHPDAPTLLLEVGRFGAVGPDQAPGTSYSYNNAGYNTAAGIIEKVTGSYKNFLKQRIYQPLGMHDSCNHESDADRSPHVHRLPQSRRWPVECPLDAG